MQVGGPKPGPLIKVTADSGEPVSFASGSMPTETDQKIGRADPHSAPDACAPPLWNRPELVSVLLTIGNCTAGNFVLVVPSSRTGPDAARSELCGSQQGRWHCVVGPVGYPTSTCEPL